MSATVVPGWTAEVRAERQRAEAELVAARPSEPPTTKRIEPIVLDARDIASSVADAGPDL